MQQTSAIATAEVRLEYSAGWRTVDEARQDESFSELITKSIEVPEELSLEEFIRLDAYYTGVIDQMLTAQTFRTAGLVDGPFVEVAENIGAIYFSNEFARSWWGQVRSDWSATGDTDFMKIVDEAILAGEPGRARRVYESIKAEVAPQLKNPKI
eukprot:CAMPEP_0201976172 /NCGR_PEP_ID=MMETSP0904-20121228/56299_1 /ASSEMBLY_ACC=CAM_ASM_000553 /TAXON_ID=420261 /ORGANISM="Thalassiosira antarctica, Strain CCMP982" /LENGTH=153 /DNA_ID=CAMNT_0048527165 /DNA_START=136 /DNA_END=597 /DNA_ORIENTATION=-